MSFSYLCPICAKPIGQEIFDKTSGKCPKCNIPVTIIEDPKLDPSQTCSWCGWGLHVVITYEKGVLTNRMPPCKSKAQAIECPLADANRICAKLTRGAIVHRDDLKPKLRVPK